MPFSICSLFEPGGAEGLRVVPRTTLAAGPAPAASRSPASLVQGLTALLLVGLLAVLVGGCIPSTPGGGDPGLCGNGQVDPGEQCDDGNRLDHDGCDGRCRVEGFCGNGAVEPMEECDDGNFEDGDGCDARCQVERGCGNGRLEVFEECDDDNLVDGDGCNALCMDEVPGAECGNAILERGEGCDDGNTEDGDGCDAACMREDGCGDGEVAGDELCDDGNTVSGDGCSWECRVEFVCGNGYCEEANYETCYLCPSDCCPDCGDGVLDPGEECDDGNNEDLDGCDKGCGDEDGTPECGNGIWELGEECEDGNTQIHDGCSDQCEIEFVCGDQQCDSQMGETCQRCQIDCCPDCGNGIREVAHGEECDSLDVGGLTCEQECYDGGVLSCTSWCTLDFATCQGSGPQCGDGTAECSEQCDGADLKGVTCQSIGYSTGTLGCQGDCTLDISGCSGLVWYLNETFEDPSWVQTNWTLLGDWEVGQPTGAGEEPDLAHEGSLLLGTNVGSDYSSSQSYLGNMAISPPVHLSGALSPQLIFWLWGASSISDGYNVWVTNNGGVDWVVLPNPSLPYDGTSGGESCWEGISTHQSWNEVVFDLSAFVGDTIQVGFALYSDSSSNYSGMYVDDVLVSEAYLVPVEITTDTHLRRASEGQAYQVQLEAKGGTGSYDWSILPGGTNADWLSIDPTTGLLAGTPGSANVGSVELTVRCAESTFPQNYQDVLLQQQVVAPVDIPYETDFDSGFPGAWILEEDWEWGTPSSVGPTTCFNGPSCIGTRIAANHSDSMTYATCVAELPPIDLAGTTNPTLSFFQWFFTYEYSAADGGTLQISSDGGSSWSSVTPVPPYDGTVSGEPAYHGDHSGQGWYRVLADLSPWVGDVVNLRFAFYSNSSTNRPGWYVDAVAVTEASDVPIKMVSGQSLGYALIGEPFSRTLAADGGPPVLAWSIQPGGTNDGWLSMDPATGTISGTPLASNQGPVSVVVRVESSSDPSNFDEQILTVDVATGLWAEDFESGSAGWTFSGNWEWGAPTGYTSNEPGACHLGSGCLGTVMGGAYSNSMTYSGNRAVSPSIDLTTAVAPQLVFSGWMALEGCCDGANVWITTDGGATWTALTNPSLAFNTTISGESAWNGTSFASWNEISFDLSAYAGDLVQIAFALHSDSSVTYPGFYVDDVLILD